MKTAQFDYELPREFIAQYPCERRDRSRLLVLRRSSGAIEHRVFADLAEYLGPGDVLVLNDTRVVPARLTGKRRSGGAVGVLLVRDLGNGEWEAMINCRGRLRDSEEIVFSNELSALVLGKDENGRSRIRLRCSGNLTQVLSRAGCPPLPPYIKRQSGDRRFTAEDAERYQTVYARAPGAVAAPTAGLHFTQELLAAIEARGCQLAYVTLHVGPGTFKPVKVENVEDHSVDPEYYSVSAAAAGAVNQSTRVVAVGTTVCRVLETLVAAEGRRIEPGEGWTNLFIYPPYRFRAVDALVTNFHLPRSSLLMLVSAFAGRELILEAYEEAKRERYRFYSYGDAMLIL